MYVPDAEDSSSGQADNVLILLIATDLHDSKQVTYQFAYKIQDAWHGGDAEDRDGVAGVAYIKGIFQ